LKFDPNAFKDVDYSWVQSLQASGVKFAVLDKNLSTQNPNEMDFQTLKATTEKLLTTSTINSDQKRVLELLQSDLKKIESDAKSQNLDPNKLLEQEKKDKIAKWEKYAVTLSAVNEQDAANRFSIYKDNGIFTEFFTQGEDSKLIKELQSVRQRLEQNQYRSISEKQKDLERAAGLESEFEAIQNLGSEGIPKERVNLYNEIVENGWKNREPITKQIQDINNGITNRIKELEDKGSLSDAEKNELSFLKEKKAEIEELTKKALSKEGYKDFLDGYARLILDLKEKNPELAEELINGVKDGKIDITRFFESRAKYGDEGEKKKAKQILTDIFSSQDFAKILKISSEEKNKYIISNGGLLQVQQDLNLSNDVTASLKNEMRSLYTSDSEYNRYYSSDSASSRYYNNGGNGNYSDSSVAQYTREERNLLTETDRLIADGGTLLTTAAENEAIRGIMNDKGVSREIAEAIYFGKDEILNRIAQNRPEEGISYLKAASLSSRSDFNDNNIYNTLGISIS